MTESAMSIDDFERVSRICGMIESGDVVIDKAAGTVQLKYTQLDALLQEAARRSMQHEMAGRLLLEQLMRADELSKKLAKELAEVKAKYEELDHKLKMMIN